MPGIADVTPFGGLVKQYQVEIDPLALDKYNLSIGQIAQAIGANNQNAGGALLDNRQQSMVIRGVGLIQNDRRISRTSWSPRPKGVPVFVRDIGQRQDRRGPAHRHLRDRRADRRRRHRADAPRRESHRGAAGHP